MSRGVSPRVSAKRGCPRECPMGCLRGPSDPGLRSVQKVSRECCRSVWNTFLTPQRHSRDTFWDTPGPGPRRHPVGHSLGHPRFRGHSRGHLGSTLGPNVRNGGRVSSKFNLPDVSSFSPELSSSLGSLESGPF